MVALYAAVIAAAWLFAPATASVTAIFGIATALATAAALHAEGRSRLRRMKAGDPHARETHHIELSPLGVRTWCAHVEARYPWCDFTRVDEDREFYIFVRPSGGAAIPKRLLDDSHDAELRKCIREWAPDFGASLAEDSMPSAAGHVTVR